MTTALLEQSVNLYFILAIGYNVLSLILNDLRGRTLAPTEPVQAIVMMTVLYVVYTAQEGLGEMAWGVLIIVFLLLILRFGIYRHAVGYNDQDYASRTAWAAAIVINIFGVIVLSLTLFRSVSGEIV
ncbi:hypothetical protein [Luteithermobacter gelatinilyticus]|uniref:hypothetical protein n=1 Tax=Luteithermobacter gelatinilyticus TaxID=2582913 RepID=UPI0011063EF1|nr:hypothetical protein [Luteithermobacter gelatinilyticus]|tara:strand:- start:6900 stop:7280 length:381 start_codon:yes stop_codon:yes gene_type:complete